MAVRWKTALTSPGRNGGVVSGDEDNGGTSRMCVSVASSVGIGVFLIVGYVAKHVAGPATLVSIVIAALIAILSALFNIELSQRLPRKASPYTFSHVCLGRFASFLTGWTLILEYAVAFAVVAKGVGLYIDTLIDDVMQTAFLAVAPLGGDGDVVGIYFDFFGAALALIVGSCFLVNLQRRRWVDTCALILCVAVVIFIITAGSFNANFLNWTANTDYSGDGGATVDNDAPTETSPPSHGGFFPFGVMATFRGAALCTFAFIGIEMLMRSNRDTQRSVSYIGMMSLTMIFLSLLGCSVVLTLMWPHYQMHVNVPFPYAFAAYNFNLAKWIVSIAAIITLSTSLWTLMFPLKRKIQTLAEDGLLPFSEYNRRAMGATLLTVVTISSLFAGFFSMGQLIDLLSVGTLLMFIVVAVAIVMLRYSHQLEIGSISTIDVSELRAVDFATPRKPFTPQPFTFPFSLGSNARSNINDGLTSPGIGGGSSSINSRHKIRTVRMWMLQIVGRATNDVKDVIGDRGYMTSPNFAYTAAAHSGEAKTVDTSVVRRPTRRSYLVVKCALVMQMCAMVGAALTVRFAEDNIYAADMWAVSVLLVFGLVAIFGIAVTTAQPQRINRNFYRVPLVATTAGFTLFACVLLVCMLDYTAWVRLLVWLCVGMPVFVVARHRRRHRWRNMTGISKIQGMHNRGFAMAAERPSEALAVQHSDQMMEIAEADETAEQLDIYVEPKMMISAAVTETGNDGNNNNKGQLPHQMKGQKATRTPSPSSSLDDIVLASDIIESCSEHREPNGKTYFVNDINAAAATTTAKAGFMTITTERPSPCKGDSTSSAAPDDEHSALELQSVLNALLATVDDVAITITSTIAMVHTTAVWDEETTSGKSPLPVTDDQPTIAADHDRLMMSASVANNFDYGTHLQSLDSASSDGGHNDSNTDSVAEGEDDTKETEGYPDKNTGIEVAATAVIDLSPTEFSIITTAATDTGATFNDFRERLSMLLIDQSRTLTRQMTAHVHKLNLPTSTASISSKDTTTKVTPLMEPSDGGLASHRHTRDGRFISTDVLVVPQPSTLVPTVSHPGIPPPPVFIVGLYNSGNVTRIPTPDYEEDHSRVVSDDEHIAMHQSNELDAKIGDATSDTTSSGVADEPTTEDLKMSIRAKLENILLRGPPFRVSTDRYALSELLDRVSNATADDEVDHKGAPVVEAADSVPEWLMVETKAASDTETVAKSRGAAATGPAQQVEDQKFTTTALVADRHPTATDELIQRQTKHRALFKDALNSITIDSRAEPMRLALSTKPATIEDARNSLRHVENTFL